ncbi:unnamed protein product [Paramecium octaurelia]|uniref:non-specific serine/threonine protein kinase n=1 Tax=Paramecium octaurelia TaxID=43137 RepID=A0A8S1XG30_PAROT|nr:unnamed protein product [Paramecium octaurelia]
MDYQFPRKQLAISNSTKDKVEACKRYIERKYTDLLKAEMERREDWAKLWVKMKDMQLKAQDQEYYKQLVLKKEAELMRKKRQKFCTDDFEPIAIIGRGAFGEVRVCRIKKTKEIVAVKKMKKCEMLAKNQLAHIRAERDILSQENPWVVELKCSFQDDKYLYLVMEYMAGGDLMTLLMKKDILTEDEAKFYIAELVLAVDSIHKMNYIHRDLKPDNILIDRKGHLKLSDFGLCKYSEIKPKVELGRKIQNQNVAPTPILNKMQKRRQLALSTVGTPDYIAPEVFTQQGYTETVDWWSVGVMLYEMVVGYPPFFSDDPQTTCQKILHWQSTFQIPQDMSLSPQCIDLIRRLVADHTERLGINGVSEIKIHPFFQGVDWKRIREKITPYQPQVNHEIDTQNFEQFEEEEPWNWNSSRRVKKDHFQGYSFNRQVQKEQSPVRVALENIDKVEFPKRQQPTQQPQSQIQQPGSPSHRKVIAKPVAYAYNKSARSNSPVNKNQQQQSSLKTIPQQQTLLNILSQYKRNSNNNNNNNSNNNSALNYSSSRLPNLKSVREQSPRSPRNAQKYYYQ